MFWKVYIAIHTYIVTHTYILNLKYWTWPTKVIKSCVWYDVSICNYSSGCFTSSENCNLSNESMKVQLELKHTRKCMIYNTYSIYVLKIKPTGCTNFLKFIFGIKLYMFQTVPLSIMRSISLYTQQWYMSYSMWVGSGWNCSSILILLTSCQQTCMTYTIAVCTVKNSWWWTEELSKTCRVLFQK